jgi:K+-sensing histidine kinase KdpD
MTPQLFSVLSPYPFLWKGTLHNGNKLEQNPSCTKCKDRHCVDSRNSQRYHEWLTCRYGFNYYRFKIGDHAPVINGLILDSNNIINRDLRRSRSSYIFSFDEFEIIEQNVNTHYKSIQDYVQESMLVNLSMFHDFKSSMNIFFRCTENIINSFEGTSFEDKLKKSPRDYQDLFDSLGLITSQLGMIDLIVNPESIKSEKKRVVNIYKLFDKLSILFHHVLKDNRGVSFTIEAERRIADSQCYPSIELVPLVLLDNAIKYSKSNSTIDIKLEQEKGSVNVIVKNLGPVVEDENERLIFEKFFRDPNAQQFNSKGLGVGLWVAQQVLQHHHSKLCYYKQRHAGNLGLNVFTFRISTITP